jgi:hypothetical protein
MSGVRFRVAVVAVAAACLLAPVAQSQPAGGKAKQPAPKPEAVAETKLLMEGLAASNLRGLGKLLRDKPADAEAWGFARGQALLVAETGNLLLLRPPRTATGQEAWQTHSADLRETATALARAAAAKDYPKARAALAGVANVCNRCHQAFRVPTRVDPFE